MDGAITISVRSLNYFAQSVMDFALFSIAQSVMEFALFFFHSFECYGFAAFSSSVWDDDFSQSEAVVRNLFLAPSSSSSHLKEPSKSGNLFKSLVCGFMYELKN